MLFSALLSCGCASIRKQWPSAQQWRSSAVNAARHPGTWGPLVGAAVIAAGDWDRDISDWAREETPLFGSRENAEDKSDMFRSLSHCGMIASAMAVPTEEDYFVPMLRRMALEHVGTFAAISARAPIKTITDRDRPNGRPESLPSGHGTLAFAYVGMTYRNIDAMNVAPVWAYGAKSAEALLGAATAWARVEAGAHYPTDVLAGAALGNFVALFIHDAFLGKDFPVDIQTDPEGGVALTLRLSF